VPTRLLLSLSLLLNIHLRTTLCRLASIMHSLVMSLARLVTRKARESTSNTSLETIGHTIAEVAHLSLRFLCLTLLVLASTFLLQPLGAEGGANELFACKVALIYLLSFGG
jgi:hypothetical protein